MAVIVHIVGKFHNTTVREAFRKVNGFIQVMKQSVCSENGQVLAVLIGIGKYRSVYHIRIRLKTKECSVLHIGETVKILPVIVNELMINRKLLSIVGEFTYRLWLLPLNISEIAVRYDTSGLHIPDITV